jgi:hypothetical protein
MIYMLASSLQLVSGFSTGSMPAQLTNSRAAVQMQTTEALVAQPVALAKVPAPPLLCPSHQPGATAAPFPASGSLCA